MSTEYESMMGILKLYELRSEPTMRKARDWFATTNKYVLREQRHNWTGDTTDFMSVEVSNSA